MNRSVRPFSIPLKMLPVISPHDGDLAGVLRGCANDVAHVGMASLRCIINLHHEEDGVVAELSRAALEGDVTPSGGRFACKAAQDVAARLASHYPSGDIWRPPLTEWVSLTIDLNAGDAKLRGYAKDKSTLLVRRRSFTQAAVFRALSKHEADAQLSALRELGAMGATHAFLHLEVQDGEMVPQRIRISGLSGDAAAGESLRSLSASLGEMACRIMQERPADEAGGDMMPDDDTCYRWSWLMRLRTPRHRQWPDPICTVRASRVRLLRRLVVSEDETLPIGGIMPGDVVSQKVGIA